MYTIFQELYNFFGNSVKGWDILSTFTSELKVTLKKLYPTRWSIRVNTKIAVKLRYFNSIKSLYEITLSPKNFDEWNEANIIFKKMFKGPLYFASFYSKHPIQVPSVSPIE